MLLNCSAEILYEYINPLIKKCPTYTGGVSKNNYIRNSNRIINILYNDIEKSFESVNKLLQGSCFRANVISNKKEFLKPNGYNNRFLPDIIREYIDKNKSYQLCYECTIANKQVRLYFTLFSRKEFENISEYHTYVRIIYAWLHVCFKYSKKPCANKIDIYFYLTPMRKWLPHESTTILGSMNVNTAFSTLCAANEEIVIYRKEEWLKVLIHETFHAFGFDLGLHSSPILKQTLSSIFKVDIDFNAGEAYTETWARIINCVLWSYLKTLNKNKTDFYKTVQKSLQLERLFSIYQMIKVMKYMGISFENLLGKTQNDILILKNAYRETTPVFSYYILCGMCMCDYYAFLNWCNQHNTFNKNKKILQFHATKSNYTLFGKLMETLTYNKMLINTIECIDRSISDNSQNKRLTLFIRTMRMSMIDHSCF